MGTTTTSQSYTSKTGTIPTEFGIMTDLTAFSLYGNTFATIPTQLGLLVKLSTNLNLYVACAYTRVSWQLHSGPLASAS